MFDCILNGLLMVSDGIELSTVAIPEGLSSVFIDVTKECTIVMTSSFVRAVISEVRLETIRELVISLRPDTEPAANLELDAIVLGELKINCSVEFDCVAAEEVVSRSNDFDTEETNWVLWRFCEELLRGFCEELLWGFCEELI